MITQFFIDILFDVFDWLWIKLNINLDFVSELINIASSHLDTVINILKAVTYIIPSGVLALFPFVILLITIRIAFALIWLVLDVLGSSPL